LADDGPKVGEFEEAFAHRGGRGTRGEFQFRHRPRCTPLRSPQGLKAGDEAITTPMTFAATANCVLYTGATPVFADVSGTR